MLDLRQSLQITLGAASVAAQQWVAAGPVMGWGWGLKAWAGRHLQWVRQCPRPIPLPQEKHTSVVLKSHTQLLCIEKRALLKLQPFYQFITFFIIYLFCVFITVVQRFISNSCFK